MVLLFGCSSVPEFDAPVSSGAAPESEGKECVEKACTRKRYGVFPAFMFKQAAQWPANIIVNLLYVHKIDQDCVWEHVIIFECWI